jgi:hypothetical protein
MIDVIVKCQFSEAKRQLGETYYLLKLEIRSWKALFLASNLPPLAFLKVIPHGKDYE